MAKDNTRRPDFSLSWDPDFLAQTLLADLFTYDPHWDGPPRQGTARAKLLWWRSDFYKWDGGCWYRQADSEIKRIIVEYLQAKNLTCATVDEQIPITSHRVNNVLLNLTGRIGIPEKRELNTWSDGGEKIAHTISLKNGLLLLHHKGQTKPHLLSHTPDFLTVTRLDYEYDPEADCPKWQDFLVDVMQGKQEFIFLLQQWCGYLLRPDLREQKFLLCTGEGANGKGVFFDMVEAFIGSDNCSHVPLQRFSNPFALYSTLGKVANLTSESSEMIEAEAENTLKFLVSGDRSTFERKFKEPVHAKPTAKFMVATNALPRFSDKTEGIWRRILFVPFNKVIPDEVQVKDLAAQIKTELPGILNWALDGLEKLNDAGGFTVPEESRLLLEEYRRDADPARGFLSENYMPSLNGERLASSQVYDNYRRFCDQNGYRPLSDRQFGRDLRRVFPNVRRIRGRSGTEREWLYEGIVEQGDEFDGTRIPF
jgi:putative DNA primase/helicase